jgi:hypothetical protein
MKCKATMKGSGGDIRQCLNHAGADGLCHKHRPHVAAHETLGAYAAILAHAEAQDSQAQENECAHDWRDEEEEGGGIRWVCLECGDETIEAP